MTQETTVQQQRASSTQQACHCRKEKKRKEKKRQDKKREDKKRLRLSASIQ